MQNDITRTKREEYIFLCFFVDRSCGDGIVCDFRTKTIENAVAILSALANKTTRDASERQGGNSERPQFEASIQFGGLIWSNNNDWSIEAAFDLSNWGEPS